MFAGNPAAVCPLPAWLPDPVLQAIAAENNLSETAFYAPEGRTRRLRWFTPAVEVDLCGHATLAAAFVLARCEGVREDPIVFESRSGPLRVGCRGDLFALDFPEIPLQGKPEDAAAVARALGAEPAEIHAVRKTHAARYLMAVYGTERDVLDMRPDIPTLKKLGVNVIVTAPGDKADFVSRFFAPGSGVDEDPVTGSSHCTLAPYWGKRLGKKKLEARQLSRRGGALSCEVPGTGRVIIAGRCVLFARGEIILPD